MAETESKNIQKLPLNKLVDLLNDKQTAVCQAILKDYSEIIQNIPGSNTKHQAWQGGYISHVEEAMNIGIMLYQSLNDRRKLEFTQSDLLFCIFLHDFDKVLRYKMLPNGKWERQKYDKNYLSKLTVLLEEKYNYKLSDEQYNALKYAHGEGDDYHPTDRIILPLGTLVHCADIISARVWFDNGRLHDTWQE